MPERVYIVVADSERELVPTFLPAPGRPQWGAQEILTFDEFRQLDGPGLGELVDRLASTMAKIRSGAIR
ncbi:MAG: hypothetical protein QOI38_2058 [Sphingomonadales bacterium]|jgi:hypothetical protein|nr:hypothetical protein [Sphingomonadales bacterium]